MANLLFSPGHFARRPLSPASTQFGALHPFTDMSDNILVLFGYKK
jgi:hypothetical protein